MIKVLNNSLDSLAILNNVINPIITEELNREFTLSFQVIIDNDKSDYVNYQNIIENSDNYFNIVYTKDNHNADDTLTIDVECEHVSYDLIGDENNPADSMIVDYYADVGTPTQLLTNLLAGTNFTVGAVEFSALTTLAINEKVSKRGILLILAAQLGGELKFNKYEISLLLRRGADSGLGFRYRRNLVSMSRITDNRNRVAGFPVVTYDTDVAELEFAQGHGADDHYELGDTVYLFDSQLGIIDLPVRIIKESHNPVQRMKGNVTISNTAGAFIKDINDIVVGLQQNTVAKDALYYGARIGPENGFESIRSDKKARAYFNADAFKMQSGDGSGSNWTDKLYFDPAAGEYIFDGKLTVKNLANTLAEIYKDTRGGVLSIYNNSGDLNVEAGVQDGTSDNVGGTLRIYNDGSNNLRIALGISSAQDSGIINLLDSNGDIRASIKADDAASGPTFLLVDGSGSVVTYFTTISGYINSQKIATEAWVIDKINDVMTDHITQYHSGV